MLKIIDLLLVIASTYLIFSGFYNFFITFGSVRGSEFGALVALIHMLGELMVVLGLWAARTVARDHMKKQPSTPESDRAEPAAE